MTVEKIETHVVDAQARLTSLFSNSTELKKLVGIIAGRMQDLEDVLFDLLTKRMLDAAEGEQLDVLGIHVGEKRLGRSDADYAPAIGVRILVNTSQGTEPRLLQIARLFSDPTGLSITDLFPASMLVNLFQPSGDIPTLISLLRDAKSAGVGLTVLEAVANPFTMSAALEFGEDGAHIADDIFTSAGSTFITEGVAAGDVLWIYAPQSDSGPHTIAEVVSQTSLRLTVALGTIDSGVSFDARRNDTAGAGFGDDFTFPPSFGKTDGGELSRLVI